MSKTSEFWDWNQIFLFTLADIHRLCWTSVWEHDWWLKELAMLSGWFYSSISLQNKDQRTWHGAAGGDEYGSLSFVTFSLPLKTRLLLCQRRSRLFMLTCVPSLRSFWNQPPQMNHRRWVMLNYSLPHHPRFHLNNLLVHLSLHSCESQWSFLNGNWQVNHVSVTLFSFSNLSGGNYDASQSCIAYLPISFHLLLGVLTFCRVSLSKAQWQLGFQVVSWDSYYTLRVTKKISHYISAQKILQLVSNQVNAGSSTKENDDLISGSRCRFSMCVVHDNKQHWCRLPIMRELRQDYLCELTRCNNSSPTKTRLFVLTRGCKYG